MHLTTIPSPTDSHTKNSFTTDARKAAQQQHLMLVFKHDALCVAAQQHIFNGRFPAHRRARSALQNMLHQGRGVSR